MAEMKGIAPQQRLHRRSTGNPLVDTDRLARDIIGSSLSTREKGCEFFFALHRAQSILDANGHPPSIHAMEGKKTESNGRFNLMLKKHAPLLSRHGLIEGISLSLEAGSRVENRRKLQQNADFIVEQKAVEALQDFASQKNPGSLLSFIASGLQIISDLRFNAAFLELYLIASEGVVNGTRAKVRESAERLWKAAEDAGLVRYPIT